MKTTTKTTTETATKSNMVKKSLMMCMLIIAMVFCVAGCGKEQNAEKPQEEKATSETVGVEAETDAVAETEDMQSEENIAEDVQVTVLGEGATKFVLMVTDKDGNDTYFEINTDKETVGDALLEHNLIEGEDGDYGLYIKSVNGITADYDKDQTYWAFYIDGEYAQSGVDTTPITEGSSYMLKVEK